MPNSNSAPKMYVAVELRIIVVIEMILITWSWLVNLTILHHMYC